MTGPDVDLMLNIKRQLILKQPRKESLFDKNKDVFQSNYELNTPITRRLIQLEYMNSRVKLL